MKEEEAVSEWLKLGSRFSGGALGGAAGLMVGGPAGTMWGAGVGAVLGEVIYGLATDFLERELSTLARERIGGAFTFMVAQHHENTEVEGLSLNHELLACPPDGDRPAAEEVLEAVLLVARDEPQEKKVPFLGRLMANIAVEQDLDRHTASALVRIAERLSYRQLLLLDHCEHLSNLEMPAPELRLTDRGREGRNANWPADLEAELQEMVNPMRLLRGRLHPSSLGHRLWRLMGLRNLPEEDREYFQEIVRSIRDEEEFGNPLEGIPPSPGQP